MRRIAIVLLLCTSSWGQPGAVYPVRHWDTADPAKVGWSAAKLEEARAYLSTLPPASVLFVDRGRLVAQWGDPGKRVKISSVRKSFVSALYGIYTQMGRISLDKSLAELGIDDAPALTEVEKNATVRMFLQSRSGVYHGCVAALRACAP
jgi:CubicO group peptidase (beta-lactamase class C family)